jgi:cell division protein FtsQ
MTFSLASLKITAIAAVTAALAVGAWLWLRDSSLVQVTKVNVSGVTTSESQRVTQALDDAARGMTTLHVRTTTLKDAVRQFSSVETVNIKTDFPHTMSIDVVERRPVAALAIGDRRIPVTGGGVLLRGISADRDLPTVRVSKAITGERVTDRGVLGALKVARAAPGPLLHVATEVGVQPRGVVVQLKDGPDLVFGDGEDAPAKWTAAARVLAEPSAAGATYLDLRVPGRVAAGGLAPVPAETPDPNAQPQGQNGSTVNP